MNCDSRCECKFYVDKRPVGLNIVAAFGINKQSAGVFVPYIIDSYNMTCYSYLIKSLLVNKSVMPTFARYFCCRS